MPPIAAAAIAAAAIATATAAIAAVPRGAGRGCGECRDAAVVPRRGRSGRGRGRGGRRGRGEPAGGRLGAQILQRPLKVVRCPGALQQQ